VPLDSEEQAKAVGGEVLWRHCSQCVEETDWQAESWLAEQRRLDENSVPRNGSPLRHRHLSLLRRLNLWLSLNPAPVREVIVVAPPPAPEPQPVAEGSPPAAMAEAPAPPPINWAERRTSRRIQMKTRARVRRPDGRVEIVSPLNVSRGESLRKRRGVRAR